MTVLVPAHEMTISSRVSYRIAPRFRSTVTYHDIAEIPKSVSVESSSARPMAITTRHDRAVALYILSYPCLTVEHISTDLYVLKRFVQHPRRREVREVV